MTSRSVPGSLERAVTMVRTMLAVLCGTTLLSARLLADSTSLVPPFLIAGSFLFATFSLAWFGRQLHGNASQRWVVVGIQALDTIAFVGLVTLLELSVTEGAWVLLVIPMVVASLRLNDLAIVGTWLLGWTGYVLGNQIAAADQPATFQALVQRGAVLLAVAASLALLTRWLQEGWQAQEDMTDAAQKRSDRLLTIERAARTMRQSEPDRVVQTCLSYIPSLGFAAGTATVGGETVDAVGDGEIVPAEVGIPRTDHDGVVITSWIGAGDVVVQSATVVEPQSGTAVSGWLDAEIDDALARCLWDMVASASAAVEAADHLASARFEAHHDPLTGLANRARLRQKLESSAPNTEPKAVLFIDLDDFKSVNDQHGHLVADEILIEIAKRLTAQVGGESLAARFGGDEFVILLVEDRATIATDIAEQVRAAIAKPYVINDSTYSLSASIGVAVSHQPVDPEELLSQADGAAYEAKNSGRNAVRVADRIRSAPAEVFDAT